MKTIRELLLSNQAWSREMRERHPEFFSRQTAGQRPEVLWIGCSDSRVSPEQITQTRPGEMLIHRNNANLIYPGDENFLADLQHAVDDLHVPHIVLCGHYACAGIVATLKREATGAIHSWLSGLREIEQAHAAELAAIDDFHERVNRLAELNVRDQIIRLGQLDTVRHAFERGQELTLHGWIYDLRDGIVSELIEIHSLQALEEVAAPPKVISIDVASKTLDARSRAAG